MAKRKVMSQNVNFYHDHNLGLATKARAWKGVGQECNLRITFTLLGLWENVKDSKNFKE